MRELRAAGWFLRKRQAGWTGKDGPGNTGMCFDFSSRVEEMTFLATVAVASGGCGG